VFLFDIRCLCFRNPLLNRSYVHFCCNTHIWAIVMALKSIYVCISSTACSSGAEGAKEATSAHRVALRLGDHAPGHYSMHCRLAYRQFCVQSLINPVVDASGTHLRWPRGLWRQAQCPATSGNSSGRPGVHRQRQIEENRTPQRGRWSVQHSVWNQLLV